MSRQININLKDGSGAGRDGKLTFTALANNASSGLVENSTVEEDIADGTGDVTLSDGNYKVTWYDDIQRKLTIMGTITVEAGAPIDLLELLG